MSFERCVKALEALPASGTFGTLGLGRHFALLLLNVFEHLLERGLLLLLLLLLRLRLLLQLQPQLQLMLQLQLQPQLIFWIANVPPGARAMVCRLIYSETSALRAAGALLLPGRHPAGAAWRVQQQTCCALHVYMSAHSRLLLQLLLLLQLRPQLILQLQLQLQLIFGSQMCPQAHGLWYAA